MLIKFRKVFMDQINRLRKKIDKIDLQILNLLNKRSKIAKNIGKEKKSKNLFRPERQANILKNLLNHNNDLKPSSVLAFWSNLTSDNAALDHQIGKEE